MMSPSCLITGRREGYVITRYYSIFKVYFVKKRHYNILSNDTALNVIIDLLRLFISPALYEREREREGVDRENLKKSIYSFASFICLLYIYLYLYTRTQKGLITHFVKKKLINKTHRSIAFCINCFVLFILLFKICIMYAKNLTRVARFAYILDP